jgi:ABC-2 type transport system ATP-binding protein
MSTVISSSFAAGAVDISHVSKDFPQRPPLRAPWKRTPPALALTDVTLRIPAGMIFALIGANGAGKTTLLEIVATLQLPTSGRATVCGFDLIGHAAQIKRLIGYCPAGADSFYPQLTGRANLEFFAALRGLSPRAATARTKAALAMMGALDLSEVIVQRYSAGMKQTLNLARTLLADAPILLLDEPTRSLDTRARRSFYRLLRETLIGAMKKTVLLVTHDVDEAAVFCDRVALLSGGTIAGVWKPNECPIVRHRGGSSELPRQVAALP